MHTLHRAFLGGLLLICAAFQAQGAEVKQATSIFENSSFASRQMAPLQEGATVHVTGEMVLKDGTRWAPVSAAQASGWVPANHIVLQNGDVGYIHWRGKQNSTWLWLGAGPSGMNSTDFFFGWRASGGVDWYLTEGKQFFIGGFVTSPFSKEKLTPQYNGKTQRYNTYFSAGYLLVPDRVFTRFGLGLSLLAGANRKLSNKFGASASAELGYQIPLGENSKFGASVAFEYTGKSRQSVNFVQDLGHCILGGCDPSFATPSASIYTLNLFYSFSP